MRKASKLLTLFCFLFYSVFAIAANPFDQIVPSSLSQGASYLPMDDAFKITADLAAPGKLVLSWQVAPGYYLFKNSIKIESKTLQVIIPLLPQGEEKTDEILGTYQVYSNELNVPLKIESLVKGILTVSYQGCAKAGFCYPPTTKTWQINTSAQTISLMDSRATPENSVTQVSDNAGQIHSFFANHSAPIVLALFFGLGLLLSFTPCVLPMVPIIAAILVGQGQSLTRKKAFVLSFTYWISTSLTYCVAGIITASAGKSVQSLLQTPWMIGFTALILVLLAFSLFGFYELRLPQRFEQKIQTLSANQPRGTIIGVAMMGILSALVVSPCITAPLVGALTYIAATGNVVLGGASLFLLGLGMGLPLFLIGTFGISLLPKAGAWMRLIQYFLGALLIILALFMLRPFFPAMTLPFSAPTVATEAATPYTLVHSMDELNAALDKAKQQHKPVMIDFYADWCTSCLVLEHTVFTVPEIQNLLKNFVILRVDVTKSTPQTDDIQAHFLAFAPPTFVFFDKNRVEQENAKIVGEASERTFIDTFEGLK